MFVVASASPVMAPQCEISAGTDVFISRAAPGGPGPTYHDVSLPADFFGPGSDPFDGRVYLAGLSSLADGPQGLFYADTMVVRLTDANFLVPPFPAVDTVATQVVHRSLGTLSIDDQPITVTFGGGADSSEYRMYECLSGVVSQPIGSMTIRHECPEGGTFDSVTPVIPKLFFWKLSGTQGLEEVILDPAPQLDFVVTNGCWSHTDPGFGLFTTFNGGSDHDCDWVGTPDIPFPASSPEGFFVGVCHLPCEEGTPIIESRKRLTLEQALLASHGILPSEEEGPDGDGDGMHDTPDNCPLHYNPFQEDGDGDTVGDVCDNCEDDYNPFQEDGDGDGIGDACEESVSPPEPELGGPDCQAGAKFCHGGTQEGDPCLVNEDCLPNPGGMCLDDCWGPWSAASCVVYEQQSGAARCYAPKNRYLTIDATVNTSPMAYHIKLDTAVSLDDQYDNTCGVLEGFLTAPQCVDSDFGVPVDPQPPASFPCQGEDRFGWVSYFEQAPTGVVREWLEYPLFVTGCVVVPAATFLITPSPDGLPPTVGDSLEIMTAHEPSDIPQGQYWGDVSGGPVIGSPGDWMPPDYTTSFADIGYLIKAFERTGGPRGDWVDVEITHTNAKFSDIAFVINAFEGKSYPELTDICHPNGRALIGHEPCDCATACP